MKNDYDVVVIGAGHAGCEAAWAAARLGCRVLLTTISTDAVAYLACNPSIGGTAKGHIVCEIDALGGLMGVVADKTAIQIRMLNVGKGAAVQSLRAQVDKHAYHRTMLETLQNTPNITIKQCEVAEILTQNAGTPRVTGVKFAGGEAVSCGAVVVATGVYLDSCILVGNTSEPSGPRGFAPATHLTKSLIELGFAIRRFKTGTPPRVNSASIDFSKTSVQHGDENIRSFSFMTKKPIKNIAPCHLTYTSQATHEIIRANLHRSAMYSGLIKGVGARYCPSIEDKLVRFPQATRHQIFLEPESLETSETYLQGMSTSLPRDVQHAFVRTVPGLENAEILRDAYAIEYNCINSLQLSPTLEYKGCAGLFCAGQINGTSGYEEAAAQGLVAGVNAAGGNAPLFTLSRTNSYIGVLIDDLVTVGTEEPYRMFTSRAEHRMSLRQDNADQRLTPIGRAIGTTDDKRWRAFNKKMKLLEKARAGETEGIPQEVLNVVATEKKYAGYLAREERLIAEARRQEATALPHDIDYAKVTSLRYEASQKLGLVRPLNIAQASRISGVTPADISVLLVYLRKNKATSSHYSSSSSSKSSSSSSSSSSYSS